MHTAPLGALGSLSDENISQPNARQRLPKEKFGSWRRSPSRIASAKNFPTDARQGSPKKIQKLAKKSIEDRSGKNFLSDVRRRLPEEKFGSGRRSPSNSLREKFLNCCASKIVQRKNSEVGEEVHRRSLREKFPN